MFDVNNIEFEPLTLKDGSTEFLTRDSKQQSSELTKPSEQSSSFQN